MGWNPVPFPDAVGSEKNWARSHVSDVEPWPKQAALVQAWIAFHTGNFEQAARCGLDCGLDGYRAAHKASFGHADQDER
jgi:hypothetical protein